MVDTVDQILDKYEADSGTKIKDRDNYKMRDEIARDLYDATNKNIDYLNFYKYVNPNGSFSSSKRFKETYAKDDENLQDMTDAEIADYIYNDFQQKKLAVPDYADFIFRMAPRTKRIVSPTSLKGVRTVPDYYSREELIKLSGSAVEDDPGGIEADRMRLAQTLAFNDKIALDGMSNVATDFFKNMQGSIAEKFFENNPNAKINIRKNPKTEEIEFFNPNLPANIGITDQNSPKAVYQVVNKPGLDTGDFVSIAGDAMVIIPELVGAYLARGKTLRVPFTSKRTNLLMESGGAFSGAAIGELGRVYLGNAIFGDQLKNPKMESFSFKDPVLKQASKSGVFAAMFTSIGKTIEDVARYVVSPTGARRLKKNFGPNDLSEMNINAEEAQALADKINRKLRQNDAASNLVYNVAQASDDVNLKLALAAYERTNIENMQGIMGPFRTKQAEAFRDFFKAINDKYFDYTKMSSNNPTVDEAYVGQKLKEILQNKKFNKIEDEAYQSLKLADEDLLQTVKAMDEDVAKEGFEKTGVYIKNAISEANANLNQRYNKLYKNFGNRYGKIEIPLKNITNLIQKMDNKETAFKNFTSLESLFTKDFMKDPNLTLKGAMNTLSDMKTFLRQMDQGLISSGKEGANVGQMKALVKEFDKSIKNVLEKHGKNGETGILDEYNDIVTGYAIDKAALTRTLGNIMRVDGGVPKILDEDVFATTFKAIDNNFRIGQKARIDDLFEVIKDKPRILQAYKRNIETFYRREVLDDQGKVNLKKHDAFM